MVLDSNFKEFITLLNEHEVKYLLIGGYAVALHGHPRYTGDIDFWIWTNPENAQKVLKTLKDFGFGSLPFDESDFLNPATVVQLGYPPLRIDLTMSISGVPDFETAYKNCKFVDIEGLKVPVIGIADLKKNKKAAGRHKDLADLDNLE
jgi:predicted nucleotidyltransferase